MTAAQADLFGYEPAPAMKPDGFDYWPGVLSADEQTELAWQLQSLSFKPYEHMGYQGFRRIVAFGRRYEMERSRLEVADPWPDFLQLMLARLTERIGLDKGDFVQALINEYAPGAGIGWHRDRPVYGEILGVSLLAPCVMRLRQRDGAGWRRSAAPLAPGSAYRLSGEARREWEHSISPMSALRYSITFRTLA
ncbi:alpha-ketoglutarate-dependent dioxygenase AlkB [Brevundimonas pondensis]|uniref:Alpha-ketoglutarate-dependent dioxygenase AlkB n=1 Tax=Brevundimonas pondensis TaxID=2774189 RepID=A0ABX7SFU8_9CAUL|nr:alpha-ketoglutarate-dependent dioxygenase AlkB [Brevundimonas pondensis]QTC86411.1 alpha-ketoglutarate-dependent dioxygenase AlkB [Brevundimonas pondensis]